MLRSSDFVSLFAFIVDLLSWNRVFENVLVFTLVTWFSKIT